MIIVIAVVALAILGAVLIISTLQRRNADAAAGFLSRETRSRDKASRKPVALEEGTSGRDVEKAAVDESGRERRDPGGHERHPASSKTGFGQRLSASR